VVGSTHALEGAMEVGECVVADITDAAATDDDDDSDLAEEMDAAIAELLCGAVRTDESKS